MLVKNLHYELKIRTKQTRRKSDRPQTKTEFHRRL